jgi:hypothetical protein
MKHRHAIQVALMTFSFAASMQLAHAQESSQQTELRPPVVVEGAEPRYVAPNTRDRIGRIWAPVMIDGRGPFRLVLDTSGSSSAIIPSVAERLGVSLQQAEKRRLIGVTGAADVPVVNVESMIVGDIALPGGKIPVVADAFGGAEGVLGPKGFSDKRIFIDFANDTIRITRSIGRVIEPGATRVPVKIDRNQLLTFDIRVGGVKTKAILSTGGQRTIGNNALREALLKRAREGKEEDIIGVTLDVATGHSIAVPPIAIEDLTLRNVKITFAEPYIFEQWKLTREPAMLVGMDVIGSLGAVVIDYKMEELQLRTRR